MGRVCVWAVVLAVVWCDLADAQLFRRRFRGSCSAVTSCPPKAVEQVVVAEQATPVVEKTDVYVVQNNNPAPLVAQGATSYTATGYQAAVLPFFDPNAYFEQELQLHKAAERTAALRAERTAALVEKVVQLQAPAVEAVARGQAAAAVLRAAGLDPAHNRGGPTGVLISRDAAGRVTVTQIDPQTAQAVVKKTTVATQRTVTRRTKPAVNARGIGTTGTYPTVAEYCGKCHGTDRNPPSGGYYIGDSPAVARVLRDTWFELTRRVSDGSMPPAGSPQPSREEKVAIINEIEQMILKGTR